MASLLLVVGFASSAMLAPPMSAIRRSTMESDVIVEGTILSVAEVAGDDRARTAVLSVERVVWSEVPVGDRLELNWMTNSKVLPDGTVQTTMPGPTQLDEYVGSSALWLLVDKDGLRCKLYPLKLGEMPVEEIHHLSMAVQDPEYVDPARPWMPKMRLVPELEADPKAAEKRSAMVEYLDGQYESRRK